MGVPVTMIGSSSIALLVCRRLCQTACAACRPDKSHAAAGMQNGLHKGKDEPLGVALPNDPDIVYNVDTNEEAASQLEVRAPVHTYPLRSHEITVGMHVCSTAHCRSLHGVRRPCTDCGPAPAVASACVLCWHAQVLPITVYHSDYVLELRRQIAVNRSFICYALKQGHIRVLSTQSAHRSLIKAHKPPLTDLQCAHASSPPCMPGALRRALILRPPLPACCAHMHASSAACCVTLQGAHTVQGFPGSMQHD